MLERLFPQQADDKLFVEDVFSTWLYTGNGSTQTITNGIDLAGKGGLVWLKARSSAQNNFLFDTNRGVQKRLVSNSTAEEFILSDGLSSFNSNGFTLGSGYTANGSGLDLVSWTFREAPNFFDVVTYTGNGVSGRAVPHNLGIAPGCIIVKSTNSAGDNWVVYHRSLPTPTNAGLYLNTTDATQSYPFFPTAPDATNFYVGGAGYNVNSGSTTYVAYLFAHNTASDGIIQCGSYTTTGADQEINLGWEPQWVLIKNTNIAGNAYTGWGVFDTMRGFTVDVDNPLLANRNNAENGTENANSVNYVDPTATGFRVKNGTTLAGAGSAGYTYIYVAIRRGPMRTPTLGTSVFSPIVRTGTGAAATVTTGNLPDWIIMKAFSGSAGNAYTRLTGNNRQLYTNLTLQEIDQSAPYGVTGFLNTSYTLGLNANNENQSGASIVNWAFSRAPGFMDVVCYTGNGTAGRTVNHNLGVAPELIIVKGRNNAGTSWLVYAAPLGATQSLFLNLDYQTGTYPYWNNTTPTATVFTVGSSYDANTSGGTYVSYLFASAPGVSKVGTYTGNGSSQTINCAFTTGARFVLIKRTDSTGDWYVWDSARGIVAGNDPYLALNTTAAEVTSNDSVDPDSTGFVVNQVAASNINVNGATYIFLSIA